MPLRDFECQSCHKVQERFYHTQADHYPECQWCSGPLDLLELSAGIKGKTGVFPYDLTVDGKTHTISDMGSLRRFERTHGMLATAFSQEHSNPDGPRDLPETRPGGRAYEGLRFKDHCAEQRERGIRDAVRAVETGRYRR